MSEEDKQKDIVYKNLSEELKPYFDDCDCCTYIVELRKDKVEKEKEIERINNIINELNDKIKQYEEPEDMTLMFMWCDEKAKDEIKRLNNIINELEKELDRGYKDLFEYELVPGRELITNIKNYLQELKESDKE